MIVRPKLDSCLRVVSGADGSELRKALELAVVWTQGQISLLVIGRAGCSGRSGSVGTTKLFSQAVIGNLLESIGGAVNRSRLGLVGTHRKAIEELFLVSRQSASVHPIFHGRL